MSEDILNVEGLCVDIPTRAGVIRAVRNVDFSVRRGETLGIVGESGCGKTLTSLALMDLLPQRAVRRAGRLDFAGIDLANLPAQEFRSLRGNRMSMVFQEPMTALNPTFTVGEQLADVMCQHQKVDRAAAEERAAFLLRKVGIENPQVRLRQYPHQLSGGLRQRIVIAMALMCGPDLLLADEPTTALDVTIQAELLHLLADLKKEFGMTMILITHDFGVVSRLADRVAVMYAGEVVEYGSVKRIFESPAHPYTRGLLACLPTRGRPRLTHLPSIPGGLLSLYAEWEGCSFAERCDYVQVDCRSGTVAMRSPASGHAVRCIYCGNFDRESESRRAI